MKPIDELKLRDIMSRKVLCVSPECRLVNAAQRMGEAWVSSLVVGNGTNFIGILTERDIVRLLRIRGNRQIMVGELMSTSVLTAPDELDFRSAFALFRLHRVRHLVVVDGQSLAIGLVSASDFRTHLALDVFRNIGCVNGDADRSVSTLASEESLDSALELMMDRQSDDLVRDKLQQEKTRLESQLHLVLEASGLGVWEYDHTNDLTTWSPGLCTMTGYPPGQAPASFEEWIAMIHPVDRPVVLAKASAAMVDHGPLYEAEYRLRKQDGGWLWIAARGRVVRRDMQGNPLCTVGTMQDISARKHTELLLQAQHDLATVLAGEPSREVLLKAILDSALSLPELDGGGVYWLQEDGSYALLFHRGLSDEFIAATKHLPKDSLQAGIIREGRMRCSCCEPLTQCVDLELVEQANLVVEGIRSLVVQPILVDGTAVACLNLASLHVARICGETLSSLLTLTRQFNQALQRQFAQQEASHQRENLQGLFEALNDYLFVLDENGLILYCNSAVTDHLGYGSSLLGKPVWTVHPESVQEEAKKITAEMMAGLRKHCPLPIKKANGQIIYADTRVVKGYWYGKPAIFGISRDVTEQVVQQKALLCSETLLRTILDSTAEGILVVGTCAKVLVTNKGFLNLWRIPEELINEGSDDRFLAYVLDTLSNPKEFICEVQNLYQSDEQRWDTLHLNDGRVIERFTQPIQLDGQRARLWSFIDITERKRMETDLRMSQERLSYALGGANDGIWDWSLETNEVYLSPRWKSMLGYGENELENGYYTWKRLIHPEDRGFFLRYLSDCLQEKTQRFEVEFRMRHKEGHWVDILARAKLACDAEGNPVKPMRLVGTHIDITERKRMENELRESEARFHAIYEQSLLGIAVVSIDEWRFISANPAYCQMLGYTEEELRHKTVADVTHPDDVLTEQEFGGLPQEPPHDFQIDKRHIAKNGEVVWTTVAGAVMFDDAGKPQYRVGMLENITHRRQIEQALTELNDSLEQRVREESAKNREKDHLLIQQSRFAAMGEMIGNIAHQWRQPLNTLGLILANIEDAHNYHELTGEYLAKQVYAGRQLIQKMSTTIDDFRNFFRPHKEVEKFSVTNAIKDAISLVSASFSNNNIDIAFEPCLDVFIMGFSNEFSQVLINLFANAKDAILQNQVAKGKVRVKLNCDGQNVVITIADNGGGIPESIMDKVFEPYFSTKELGTGIGLYMSKMIIENSMDGHISACNQGNGAEFAIRIRVIEPDRV